MKQVVLIGAGHVHMAVLAAQARLAQAGIALTLVDPGRFWYGGREAALLSGRIDPAVLRVPLRAPCRVAGATLCADRAVGLDTRHRRVWLATGSVLAYDAVSLNVGRENDLSAFADRGARVRVWDAASVAALGQLREALLESPDGACRAPRVAVLGDGPRALDIAAGLSGRSQGPECRIAVYVPGARVLPRAPPAAAIRLARRLTLRGVDLVARTRIVGLADGAVISMDGRRFAADHVVVADRSRAASFVHASGLPAEAAGLFVTDRLYSPSDERVFAAGGCARVLGIGGPPAADIEAQARVLVHNLRAGLTRRPYRRYRPRVRARGVDLDIGDALLWRGRLWWQGRWPARLKARRQARLRARLAVLEAGR